MSVISQLSPGFQALLMFAASWAFYIGAMGACYAARRLAAQATGLAAAVASRAIWRYRRRQPLARFTPRPSAKQLRAVHWGYRFPRLWRIRGAFVRWQSSRRYAARCRAA